MSTSKSKVEVFLELVLRSGLVEKDRLQQSLAALKRRSDAASRSDVDFVAQSLVDEGLLTRWQCERLLEGRYRGFFLGKYKLQDHLGSGGMSKVYLAEHVLLQRQVAIKVLPQERVEDASYLARFQREAQAAAALDHPNIVRAYDVDHDGNIHYLVMEFVEGRDLQRMVHEDGPLSYSAAADFIRQSALGLAHAHKAGLIHRDVKPANLFVDRHNVVKILDLGLARFSGGEEKASLTLSRDENVLGTADYLAPEQARDSHRVDLRADIYSLGCSLYYCLTGRPPFAEGTLPQRLMAHQRQEPPSIYDRRPDAPRELVDICLRMMAKKPAQRYQTMEEVARVLGDWLAVNRRPGDSQPGGSSGQYAAVSVSRSARGALSGGGSSGSSPTAPGASGGMRKIVAASGALSDVSPGLSQASRAERSGDVAKPRPKNPSQNNLGQPARPRDAEARIGFGTGAKKRLPVAKSLEREMATDQSAELETTSVLPQVRPTRIIPVARRAEVLWLWAAVGVGAILALGMLVLYFVMSGRPM